MADTFESIQERFVRLMHRLRRFRPPVPEMPEKLTPAEARVLYVLGGCARRIDTVRPGPLAARLSTTPSALSQILGDLEGKGLIMRSRGEGDSRRVAVSLTCEGERVLACVEEELERFARNLVSEIGPDEMSRFLTTFERIADFADAAGDSRGKGGVA